MSKKLSLDAWLWRCELDKAALAKYEATEIGRRRYAVRPQGQLGTMGWSPFAWDAVIVTARDAAEAVRKAAPALERQAQAKQPAR